MAVNLLLARLRASDGRYGKWHPLEELPGDWLPWLAQELSAHPGGAALEVALVGDTDDRWPAADGPLDVDLAVSSDKGSVSPRVLASPWYLGPPHGEPSVRVHLDLRTGAGAAYPVALQRASRVVEQTPGQGAKAEDARSAFSKVFQDVRHFSTDTCRSPSRPHDTGEDTWESQWECAEDMAWTYLLRHPLLPRRYWNLVAVAALALAYKVFASDEECESGFDFSIPADELGVSAQDLVKYEQFLARDVDCMPCARHAMLTSSVSREPPSVSNDIQGRDI